MLRNEGLRSLTTIAAALALGALVAVVVLWGARPAEAAFPGANGKIVFTSDRITDTNPTGDSEIFTMNPDGKGITQRTNNDTYDDHPSTDGPSIAFTSARDNNFEIYSMFSDGSPPDQFRLTGNTTLEDHSTISPDDTKVGYESLRGGNFEIIVLTVASGIETNLTNDPASDREPAFSPDGTKIAFTRNLGGGNFEVYVMDTDPNTDDATNLTNSPEADQEPSWSPDGSKIVFASNRNAGNFDIYTMNALDGSSQKRLTKKAAFDLQPAWSPDGKKIAFTGSRGGDDEIYTMKAKPEGTKNRPKNLTKNDDVGDSSPDWQPLVN